MIFRFDRYTLNPGTRTLSRQDKFVTLTPKVFQTLLILVENHHRVMSKAELFEQLWPQQTVEEANLTQNISILRKALENNTKLIDELNADLIGAQASSERPGN